LEKMEVTNYPDGVNARSVYKALEGLQTKSPGTFKLPIVSVVVFMFLVLVRTAIQAIAFAFSSEYASISSANFSVNTILFFFQGLTFYFLLHLVTSELYGDLERWENFKRLSDSGFVIDSQYKREHENAQTSPKSTAQEKEWTPMPLSSPLNVRAWIGIRIFIFTFKGKYDFRRLQFVAGFVLIVILTIGLLFVALTLISANNVSLIHNRHYVVNVLVDVLLISGVLLWAVKIGSDIDELRADNIVLLNKVIMQLKFWRGVQDLEILAHHQRRGAISSLGAIKTYLESIRTGDDTPKILGIPMQKLLLTSLVSYILTAVLFVLNQIGVASPP